MNDKIKVAIEVDKFDLEQFLHKSAAFRVLVDEEVKRNGYAITVSKEVLADLVIKQTRP